MREEERQAVRRARLLEAQRQRLTPDASQSKRVASGRNGRLKAGDYHIVGYKRRLGA